MRTKREFACGVVSLAAECKVIGSSDKVHVVDALAITGDEGRASLRKAGSWQWSFDPRCPNGETHPQGYPWLNT